MMGKRGASLQEGAGVGGAPRWGECARGARSGGPRGGGGTAAGRREGVAGAAADRAWLRRPNRGLERSAGMGVESGSRAWKFLSLTWGVGPQGAATAEAATWDPFGARSGAVASCFHLS